MWDFFKGLLDVLKTALASFLSYKAGKNAGLVERSEKVTEQAERGKAIREEIDNLDDAGRIRMHEKWTRQ